MDGGAGINLSGYRAGRGKSRLYLGYDLLAMLDQGELVVMLAHELAHAKMSKRGYKHWLKKGVARIWRLNDAIKSLNEDIIQAKKEFHTAALVLKAVAPIAKLGGRLVATCVRQDEFDADRLSAEVCGSDLAHAALTRMYAIEPKLSKLGWRDRVLQFQRGGSFSEWLCSYLTPRDANEKADLEQRAFHSTGCMDYAFHPSLADRLAALPACPNQELSQEQAIRLLKDPDEIAQRLVVKIEAVAAGQEKKDSAGLRRKTRQARVDSKPNAAQVAAIFLMSAGVFAPIIVWLLQAEMMVGTASTMLKAWEFCAVCMVIGVPAYRLCARRELELPFPSFSAWEAALVEQSDLSSAYAWQDAIRADLALDLPPGVRSKSQKTRYYAEKSYDWLAQCDYLRAFIASARCLQMDKRNLEGLIAYAISCAYLGRNEEAAQHIDLACAIHTKGQSLTWAIGWAASLLGAWESAEAHLLSTV